METRVAVISIIIENPESVSLLGEKSRMYCEEKFDVRKVNSDMMRIMQI